MHVHTYTNEYVGTSTPGGVLRSRHSKNTASDVYAHAYIFSFIYTYIFTYVHI